MTSAEDKAEKKASQSDKRATKTRIVLKGRKSTKVGKGQRNNAGSKSSS